MSVIPALAALPVASFFETIGHWIILILGVLFIFNMIIVGSSRVDLQACKLEYSIVSPK